MAAEIWLNCIDYFFTLMSTFLRRRSALLQKIQKTVSKDSLTHTVKAGFLNFFQSQMHDRSVERSILYKNVDLIPGNEI